MLSGGTCCEASSSCAFVTQGVYSWGASCWVTSSRAKGGAHAQSSRVPADLGSRAGSLCALRLPEPDAPHGHPRSAGLVRLAGLRRVLHLSGSTGSTDGTQGVQTVGGRLLVRLPPGRRAAHQEVSGSDG